ncbi:hypothetical protein [Pseudescherichia vulneris]|uniref:hypothetical protein n=1 Tax=Pseudescherichia vulneris TaxID=566 RepID=UPI0028A61302|nr:hypothetical protein [Pseudescherichia vulneris]
MFCEKPLRANNVREIYALFEPTQMENLSAVDHPDVFSLDMAWVRGMEAGSRCTWWNIHFSGLGFLVYPSFLHSHCSGCLSCNLALVAGTEAEKERSIKQKSL